jgi:hypothetical protein
MGGSTLSGLVLLLVGDMFLFYLVFFPFPGFERGVVG